MFSIKINIINLPPHFLTSRCDLGKAVLFLCIFRHATPMINHLLIYLIHNMGTFPCGFGSFGIFFWLHAHLFHQIRMLACIFGIADASFSNLSRDVLSFISSRSLLHNKYREPQRSNYFSDAHCSLFLDIFYNNNRKVLPVITKWAPLL